MDYDEYYRIWLHTRKPKCQFYESGENVPADALCARIKREKSSFSGIGECSRLIELEASNVNQGMLEEIAQLSSLQYLDLGWPMVAKDLKPLLALKDLRVLKINSPRHITDFSPLVCLPKLERLFLENAKQCKNLEWLRPLKNQLIALGVEGSSWTKQQIPTLAALEGFVLEALFLTSTTLQDKDLTPLMTIPNLRYLGTARNAPKAEFMALKAKNPNLKCDWFEEVHWSNFRDLKTGKVRKSGFWSQIFS